MKLFLIFGQLALAQLALAFNSSTEAPLNCTTLNRAVLKSKVVRSIQNAVEKLFEDSSFFRRRRFVVVKTGFRAPLNSFKSEIHDEQIPSKELIVPVELMRQHERIPAKSVKPAVISEALERQKRVCVPISYNEDVKEMVKKVTGQAFDSIHF